jgi:signal transduction histidine kinase
MSPLGSVGGRLALALLTVVVGVLAIVYLIVVPSYRSSLTSAELDSLQRSLRQEVTRFPLEAELQQMFADNAATRVHARVVVYDLLSSPSGPLVVVADSNLDSTSEDVASDPVARDAIRRAALARGTVGSGDDQYAEVAYPIGDAVVLLRASLHDELQVVGVIQRRMLIAGGLATVFALLLGFGGARLFTRRIRRLEAAAERIAVGDFSEPVVDPAEDELGELARTFERMRLRLSTLDRARGEFIANASHELRTPLFSLAGFLELLDDPELDDATRDEFVAQMRDQVSRLTKLATDLLDLSRLDAGRLTVANELIDLSELADELGAELGPRAAAAEHVLEVVPDQPVPASGDAERVLQIGRILIENALVHTPPGTHVRVGTAVVGGRATLTVANDGPEIPREAEEQVFHRFYRLDGTRASGSGLGLAIARELADLMSGRLELTTEDGWTRFTLVLRSEAADRALAGQV